MLGGPSALEIQLCWQNTAKRRQFGRTPACMYGGKVLSTAHGLKCSKHGLLPEKPAATR